MKKLTCTSFLFITALSFGQWNSDLNLTNSPGSSTLPMNGGKSIMVDGNNVHVVYSDGSSGNPEVYYKKSNDGGQNWYFPLNISNTASMSFDASVYFVGNKVWAFWTEIDNGNSNLYWALSEDYGDSWSTATPFSPAPTNGVANISFCPSDSYIYAIWNPSTTVYIANLYGGISSNVNTIFSGNTMGNPAIASNGSDILIAVVSEFVPGSGNQIIYRRSTNYGSSFSTATPLPNQTFSGITPDIAIEGSHVHVTWIDNSTGTNQVFYQHSGDYGQTWDNPQMISIGTSTNAFPSIEANGNNVVITWERDLSGNKEIYYANSSTAGITWNPQERLTNANENSERSCVDISTNGSVHTIWIDHRDLNYEIYYNKAASLPNSGGVGVQDQVMHTISVSNPVKSGEAIVIHQAQGDCTDVKLITLLGEEIPVHISTQGSNRLITPDQYLSTGIYLLYVQSEVVQLVVE